MGRVKEWKKRERENMCVEGVGCERKSGMYPARAKWVRGGRTGRGWGQRNWPHGRGRKTQMTVVVVGRVYCAQAKGGAKREREEKSFLPTTKTVERAA